MKFITGLIVLCFVFGAAYSQEPKVPSSTAGKTNDNVENEDFFTDDPLFDVYFMGATPRKSETPVDTDIGTVTMVSYMYEKSNAEAYMLAKSTYPDQKVKNSDAQSLLQSSKSGFCKQLGVNSFEEKSISLGGHSGIFFKASGNGYYAAMADYLVENTLIQIGILRSDRMASEKEIEQFIYSLRIKNQSADDYFSDNSNFKINFFGEKPTKNVKPVETAVGTINMTTYMYEKSPKLIYMVALSDYPEAYVSGSDASSLLKSVKEGYVGNMNLNVTQERKITHKGHPGIFFKASGNGYHTDVVDYLVDNRLYQVAILRTDRASTEKEIQDFLYSFELK